MMKLLLALLPLAVSATGWSAVKYKWDLVPFQGGFSPVNPGWQANGQMIDSYCPGQSNGAAIVHNGSFVGMAAYSKKGDKTITVIYDHLNQVSGMQMWIPTSKWTPGNGIAGQTQKYYQRVTYQGDQDYWVQTVYFKNPSQLCSASPTPNNPFGNALYIQNGSNPLTDYFQVPMTQTAVNAMPEYHNTGKCFWTMGQHFWGNARADMKCQDFIPYCLLYNKGKLNAFCFATNANMNDPELDSPHPTPKVLGQFMADPPKCLSGGDPNWSVFSTVHVYFTGNPRTSNFC